MSRYQYEKYRGLLATQKEGTFDCFRRLFVEEEFDRIIELGTGNGVLTAFLAAQGKTHNFDLHSFDIKVRKRSLYDVAIDLGVKLYREDIIQNKNKKIVRLLGEGRTLLLCDNGNKIREWHLYAPHLKELDVIMAHDYFKGPKGSKEGTEHCKKVWGWVEITDRDVEKINSELNLQPFWAEEFASVAWGSKIKEAWPSGKASPC